MHSKRTVLVINPNSTKSMTEGLEKLISQTSFSNLNFNYFTAPSGPSSINNEEDGAESTKHCIPALDEKILERHDAFIVACYSDHSLVPWLEAQPIVQSGKKPVVGILQASVAQSVKGIEQGQLYGIVSTGKYWEKALTEAIKGFADPQAHMRLRGVETTGLNATELHGLPQEKVFAKLTDATRRLVKPGNVAAVCLGCAGMAGMDQVVRDACILELGDDKGNAVQVVDGVIAAARIISIEH